jgi:Glycosyl hydrolases family 2, TIM barrel domain
VRRIESVTVSDFQLLVRWRNPDGTVDPPAPFEIRGISWSPAQRGGANPVEADYLRAADRDLPLMRMANINTVKTYAPIGYPTLDKLLAHGIVAIPTVLARSDGDFETAVEAARGHPALLMWLIGNEWNLNRLYNSCAIDACFQRIEQVARRIKEIDPLHPVATSFAPNGEIPSASDLQRLPSVDVWGLNVYSQPGFFNRFMNYRQLAQQTGVRKPIFFSEYGADAFDNLAGRPDPEAQARALRQQTLEIRNQLSARSPAFPCLGGTPFEWNDEWWKRGNPNAQDLGGFANPGVAADRFANEEWWGIVDIDRKPRPAFEVLKELYAR